MDRNLEIGRSEAAVQGAQTADMAERITRAMRQPAQRRDDYSPQQWTLAQRGLLLEGIHSTLTSVEIRMPNGDSEIHDAEPVFISGNTLMVPKNTTVVGRTTSKPRWNI